MEFEKYHKVKRLGDLENKDIFLCPDDEIIVEEKIDGANFRFYINQERIPIFGSRTQQITSDEGENKDVAKGFTRCIEYVRNALKDKNLEEYKGFIFYGECCIKHTINYDWEKIPPFLGFDIKNEQGYLHFSQKDMIFNSLGLSQVPLVGRFYAREILETGVNDSIVPISEYALPSAIDRKAEGVVFKNYDKQIFAKYVRDAFKEKNAEVFGGNPKYNKIDDTNNQELVFKYCTNARIDKHIFKLIDEGHELNMKLMQYLPKNVYVDIMEEEWREILIESKWKIDLKNLNKTITKRCLAVLQQVITNNALNGGK